MFVRLKTADNKDGSKRHYLQICENNRIEGKVRQKVLCNLGRVEELQEGKLDNLIRSLAKFSQNLAVVSAAEDLFAEWSREYGPAMVFRKLWESLGLHDIIHSLLDDREITIDIQEAIFCMVLNRLTDPSSKLGVTEWKDKVYRDEFETLQLSHFYKALDFLDENKNAIEEKLYFRHTDLFTSQLDLVFFDTTTTYVEGGAGAFDLLDYGHSKDHRPDRMQVMIGVLMSRDGMPIAHHVFPGNTADTEAFKEAVTDLKKRFHIQKVIVVGDRGMMGKKTLELLNELGFEYILGVRMRNIKNGIDLIQSAVPYQEIPGQKNLKIKEIDHPEGRYIVCLNEEEAKRDKLVREQIEEKLKNKLDKYGVKELIGNSEYRRYLDIDKESAEISEEKLQKAKVYDGIYILRTNTRLSAEEITKAYKDLWQIERAFRDLKSTLEIRPMYHWKERRIHGHIVLCFLALVLQIRFQKQLSKTTEEYGYIEVMRALRKVNIVKLQVKDEEYLVRTEIQGAATAGFRAVGAKIAERVQRLSH